MLIPNCSILKFKTTENFKSVYKMLCIWHWIGKNRCKIGECVLKHATVWISISKISN